MTWQLEFVKECLDDGCLMFGDFTLKSGRRAPYFFNSGSLSHGKTISSVATAFAKAIIESKIEFDFLFGAAYKGIPLVTAITAELWTRYGRDIPYLYNRKEPKECSEKGSLVGNVEGVLRDGAKVLIVDDVITVGSAAEEVVRILSDLPKKLEIVALFIIFDRQESVDGSSQSACKALEIKHGITVRSLISIETVISYLQDSTIDSEKLPADALEKIQAYQQTYGAFRK